MHWRCLRIGVPTCHTSLTPLTEHEPYHTSDAQQHDWYGQPDAPRRTHLLDKPSSPHPILNQLMDEALTRILLVSDGAVMALKERTTGSKVGTIEPTSWLASVVHELDTRYEKCKTHRARLVVVKDAQDVADKLRYAPDRSKVRGTAEWREVIATDPRSTRVLAAVWGVSHMTIARIKKQARKS